MGTWNTKPFGNDTASDWLWELEEAKDDSVLKAAFEADADEDETVAAAAMVEAARRQPMGVLPPKAKAWVSERGFVPSNALVKQAMAAIEKIRNHSELRELWEESGSLKSWLKQMDTLLAGLRECQSLPPPVRLPKAPPTPRKLEMIIEKVKPDEESPLRQTLRKKLEAITDLEAPVARNLFPETPLTLLAKQGLLPEAKRLVERGAKVNLVRKSYYRHSPLEAACRSGHAEMVKWLLEQGATIYVERTALAPTGGLQFESKTVAMPTALYAAIKSGSIATIKILLEHDSQLLTDDTEKELNEKKFWHDTLLHKAVEANHPHVIEFLFRNGVDLEGQDSLGGTALNTAANQTNNSINNDTKKVVEMLLSLGANPNAKGKHGFTALDLVSESRQDIAELIKKFGGRLGKEISD